MVLLYCEAESPCNSRGSTKVTEIPNQTTDSNSSQNYGNSEPLVVATNTTLDYDATGNNLTYDTESQPLAVGTNLTIEITYAEAELLEQQLGISLDGSDGYLGSNITVIDGDRDWLERIDNNPFGSEDMSPNGDASDDYSWDLDGAEENAAGNGESAAAEASEPLLVGTNITFILTEDTDGNSDSSGNENLYTRDEQTPFALGSNLLLELPDESGQGNYLGNNLSTIEDSSETQAGAMGEQPAEGGMMPAESANAPSDNGDYVWDFNDEGQASFTSDSSEGMGGEMDADALFTASPWGELTETGAVDGFEDVFPNGAGEIDNLAGGFGGGEV